MTTAVAGCLWQGSHELVKHGREEGIFEFESFNIFEFETLSSMQCSRFSHVIPSGASACTSAVEDPEFLHATPIHTELFQVYFRVARNIAALPRCLWR
jgi:hypothetical protein